MLETNISCKNIFSHYIKCLLYYDQIDNTKCSNVFKKYNQCIEIFGDV